MTSAASDLASRLKSPTGFASMVQIMDKWADLRRFRHNRLQEDFFRNYSLGTGQIDLVVKARQATVTTAALGETLRLVLTRATRCMTLMDIDQKTTELRAVLDRMYNSLPDQFSIGNRTVGKAARYTDNRTTSSYSNGSRWTLGTAGSVGIGRGTTLDLLHGSEVAYWTDARAVVKGAQQAAKFAIWRLYESTTNGAYGWFYDAVKQAQDPKNRLYKLHFYQWWWTDEYRADLDEGEVIIPDAREQYLRDMFGLDDRQIKWRRLMIAELGDVFQQEYPEDIETCFLQSGFGYFGNIEGYFTADLMPLRVANHVYVAGLDFGQQKDFTVLYVLDATTMQQVDLLRINHESWKLMRDEIRKMLKKWNVQLCIAEKNSMGSSQIESLREECDNEGLEVTIWSFDMNVATKPPLMRTYRTAMHEGGLRHQPRPVVLAEHRAARAKNTPKGWTVESPRDEVDSDGNPTGHGDTVVAGALAVKAASGIAA